MLNAYIHTYHSRFIPEEVAGTSHIFLRDIKLAVRNTAHNRWQVVDGTAIDCAERTIAEAKQHWSVIGWLTKNLFYRAAPCFGRHVKPLVPIVFAVVSTHQSALDPHGGYGPFSLWVIHKDGLCPKRKDIS
jgi:hypothetical protein